MGKVHYLCTGCGTISDKDGLCFKAGCPLIRRPLKKCGCVDGNHFGDLDKFKPKKPPPPPNPLEQFTKDLFPE